MNEIWIVRHGETAWTISGRHTSRTDVPLTADGRAAAGALAPLLTARHFALVLTSPMVRARDTAAAAGFGDAASDADLHEWDYGEFEGETTDEIRTRAGNGSWSIWRGTVPGGESIDDVAARCARVLARADAAAGDVLLFGHGHALRVFVAVALELDPHAGERFALEPASVGVLGSEREVRVLRGWNVQTG